MDCEFCLKETNFRNSYQKYMKNYTVAVCNKSLSLVYQCQHHAVFTIRKTPWSNPNVYKY